MIHGTWVLFVVLDDNVRTVMSRLEHDLNDTTMVYAGVGYTPYHYQQNLANGRPDALGTFNAERLVRPGHEEHRRRRGPAHAPDHRSGAPHAGTRCELPRPGNGLLLGDLGYHHAVEPLQPFAVASHHGGAR